MVKEEKLCGSTCTKIILLYCRFERDITKTMLGYEQKRVSLHWELNSILQILRQKMYCIDQQHGFLVNGCSLFYFIYMYITYP